MQAIFHVPNARLRRLGETKMSTLVDLSVADSFYLEPKVWGDDRGYFVEKYRASQLEGRTHGPFLQFNQSRSTGGVLRGLHLQVGAAASAKWVECILGAIWDVCVDLRPDSPTYKHWVGLELSEENHRGIYVPPGCGHGFCVLGDSPAVIRYAQTSYYDADAERCLLWSDPTIGIDWPITNPILSDKDASAPRFTDDHRWEGCRGLLNRPT